MLGIVLNLPPAVEHYVATTPVLLMATQALIYLGWIPIFGILIWGFTQIWVDYKQGLYFSHLHWVLLEVRIPQGAINTPKGMENFFNNLAGAKSALTWKETRLMGKFQAYFSLEIVGSEGGVKFFIRCLDKHRDLVEAALYAQYPEAQIMEAEDYVNKIPTYYPSESHKVFGSEMVLAKPDYYPLRTYEDFEHLGEKDFRFKDPLLNTIELMGKMGKDEHLWIQIIIMPPEEQDWAKQGEAYLMKMLGKEKKDAKHGGILSDLAGAAMAFPAEIVQQATGVSLGGGGKSEKKAADDWAAFKMTPGERDAAERIAEKITKLGWLTKIRVLYAGPMTNYRKPLMASAIKGIFHPYAHLSLNKLGLHNKATPKDDYFWMEWQMYGKMTKLVKRYKARLLGAGASPFILNSEELATLFHFPSADARTPILSNASSRRAEAPAALPFADADAPSLPDWKELMKGKEGHEHEEEPAPLAVPQPHMPGQPHQPPAAPAHGHDPHHAPKHAEPHVHELVSSHTPTPVPPAAQHAMHNEEFMPQPGRPAPLPPGLDLAPKNIKDDDDAPDNLPVM